MQSRLLVNLLLLIAVIGLATLAVLTADKDDKTVRFIPGDKNTIENITIARTKGDIVLHKQNNQWQMITPYTLPAHEFRINQLLNLLQLMVEHSYPADKASLEKFGLLPAAASIKFDAIQIDFGITNPVNQKRYIHHQGKIALIEDKLYPLISSQPSSFLDLSLVDRLSIIEKLILPDLALEKDSNNMWQSRGKNTVNADQVNELIANWKSAQAFGIHAYMPRKNLGKIEIQLNNKRRIIFEISDDKPWLILARPELNIEYHLDNSLINKLIYPQKEKRDDKDA
ncbi:MAG: hypothetical protein OEY43_04745 [Gammaproteobacteria bacterium]|nr:hypothetical protein [Gammaproteobacteria bacterium]